MYLPEFHSFQWLVQCSIRNIVYSFQHKFLALRYRYRSGDSISHTQCLSFVGDGVVVVCPLHIFANSSFIFHPSLLKFYRHVQNYLAHKRKFSKTCFWVKKILKKYFSEKIIVFCELLIHFSSEPAQILQACAE